MSWRKRVIKFLLSNGADTEQEDPRVKNFSYLKFKSFVSPSVIITALFYAKVDTKKKKKREIKRIRDWTK